MACTAPHGAELAFGVEAPDVFRLIRDDISEYFVVCFARTNDQPEAQERRSLSSAMKGGEGRRGGR